MKVPKLIARAWRIGQKGSVSVYSQEGVAAGRFVNAPHPLHAVQAICNNERNWITSTYCLLRNLDAILHIIFSIMICWFESSYLLTIMLSNECHRTLLMVSQHWFRQRLGGIMQQAVNLANFDPDLCRHMSSWGHSDLTEWPLRYTSCIIIFNV